MHPTSLPSNGPTARGRAWQSQPSAASNDRVGQLDGALRELSCRSDPTRPAFKTIYAGEQVNFQNMKKQDLPLLAKKLGENVNKRLGVAMVQDVLIDQLSYIPKSDVRGPPKL